MKVPSKKISRAGHIAARTSCCNSDFHSLIVYSVSEVTYVFGNDITGLNVVVIAIAAVVILSLIGCCCCGCRD
jgi:hypothetical protein